MPGERRAIIEDILLEHEPLSAGEIADYAVRLGHPRGVFLDAVWAGVDEKWLTWRDDRKIELPEQIETTDPDYAIESADFAAGFEAGQRIYRGPEQEAWKAYRNSPGAVMALQHSFEAGFRAGHVNVKPLLDALEAIASCSNDPEAVVCAANAHTTYHA